MWTESENNCELDKSMLLCYSQGLSEGLNM